MEKRAKFDRNSELIICAAQSVVVFLVFAAYIISPKAHSPWMIAPVPSVCIGLFTLIAIRLILIKKALVDKFLVGFIIAENIALGILIWSFHIQYQVSPGLSLKAPSFVFFFVFTALRALRFQAKFVVISGLAAISTWVVMIVLAVRHPEIEITRSFTEYISSFKVLIGAEVEKIIALSLFTGILAIAVHRASKLLNRGIANEKEKNRLLKELITAVEQKNQEKTQFLHLMHHELKTPLTAILGYSGLLLMDNKESMELKYIEDQGKHLLKLIERILYFVEVSDMEQKELTQVEWEEIVDNLMQKFAETDSKVPLNFQGNNFTLLATYGRLRDALWEFIHNAIEVSETGVIEVSSSESDTDNVITIRDYGPGMTESQVERSMELFTQKDNAFDRTTQENIGLGIPLAKRLIESMGGSCSVNSKVGEGTEVHVTIPKKAA